MANAPSQFNLAKGVATVVPHAKGMGKCRPTFSFRVKGMSESLVIAELKKRYTNHDIIIESLNWSPC